MDQQWNKCGPEQLEIALVSSLLRNNLFLSAFLLALDTWNSMINVINFDIIIS